MALVTCFFVGCGYKAPEAPTAQEVKKIRIDAEKQVQEANIQRIKAENLRQFAEQDESNMRNMAWALGVFVIIALLIGVALGSSSRKDAKDRKKID